MDRVPGNLVWWNQQLKDLGVDQAALRSEPNDLTYGLGMIFTTFMDRLKTWFYEGIAEAMIAFAGSRMTTCRHDLNSGTTVMLLKLS